MRATVTLLSLAVVVGAANAIVCFRGICDTLPKHESPKCEGSLIKNGGYCGCYDVCAKVNCVIRYMFSIQFVFKRLCDEFDLYRTKQIFTKDSGKRGF